ncbi:MAG: GNAT family N-acetyltransferase [Anaerolineae bacterium]
MSDKLSGAWQKSTADELSNGDALSGISLRTFMPDDASRMVSLQKRCLDLCPDISVLPEGFYHGPSFEGGKNILCAIDDTGGHIGHAMVSVGHIHRRLGTRMLWMDLRVDPALEKEVPGRGAALRDLLLVRITARARQLAADLERPAMLYATYFARGQAGVEYLKSRGFEPFERIIQLRRDLERPIPTFEPPVGVEVRPWRMETEAEQRRYLDAYDAAFANEGKRLDQLQHFMKSSVWAGGTTITAFDGDRVVGSVMAYFNPDRGRNPDRVGATEYVFVRPEWRRRGIARYLLARTLRYLKVREMAYASLEVLADNGPALLLYRSVGYEPWREEISLGIPLTKEGIWTAT